MEKLSVSATASVREGKGKASAPAEEPMSSHAEIIKRDAEQRPRLDRRRLDPMPIG